MQVYVHRDGHNLGPYSIGQLRSHLQAGNFTGDDLACLDGVNWVALKAPRIVDRKSKPVPQARTTPEEPVSKPNKNRHPSCCGNPVCFLFGLSAYFLLKNEIFPKKLPPLLHPGESILHPNQLLNFLSGRRKRTYEFKALGNHRVPSDNRKASSRSLRWRHLQD